MQIRNNNINQHTYRRDLSYLLHEDHHGTVDLDGHDGGQKAERDVGEDRDQGVVTDREEQGEDTAEQTGRGCRVIPVEQLASPLLTNFNNKYQQYLSSSNHVKYKYQNFFNQKFNFDINVSTIKFPSPSPAILWNEDQI